MCKQPPNDVPKDEELRTEKEEINPFTQQCLVRYSRREAIVSEIEEEEEEE